MKIQCLIEKLTALRAEFGDDVEIDEDMNEFVKAFTGNGRATICRVPYLNKIYIFPLFPLLNVDNMVEAKKQERQLVKSYNKVKRSQI